MKKWKNWMALGLTAAMGTALLMGCGAQELPDVSGKYPVNDSEATQEKAPETEQGTTGTETDGNAVFKESANYGWSQNSDSDGEAKDTDSQDGISAELAQIEEKAQELQNKLQNDSLSQSEMNQLSAEIYMLWDDELNAIWTRLKNTLDADTMTCITKEERAWIKEKEQKIQEAGSEWEGGSGQPLAENTEGADLTRARVYELAEYLK